MIFYNEFWADQSNDSWFQGQYIHPCLLNYFAFQSFDVKRRLDSEDTGHEDSKIKTKTTNKNNNHIKTQHNTAN